MSHGHYGSHYSRELGAITGEMYNLFFFLHDICGFSIRFQKYILYDNYSSENSKRDYNKNKGYSFFRIISERILFKHSVRKLLVP